MGFTDNIRLDDVTIEQRQERLTVALPIRAEAVEGKRKVEGGARNRDRAIDGKMRIPRRVFTGGGA